MTKFLRALFTIVILVSVVVVPSVVNVQETKAASTTAPWTDSSASYHDFTANGGALQSATAKIGPYSAYFDGDGDYIDSPDSSDWDLSSGDWTIDFWVRFSDLPAASGVMGLWYQDSGSTTNKQCGFIYNAAGSIYWYFRVTSGGSNIINLSGLKITAVGTWYHVAYVRTGTTYKLYIGTSGTNAEIFSSSDDSTIPNFTENFEIATYAESTCELYGCIDEFRVSKGIARWTSTFSVPTSEHRTDSYTKLLLHFDASTSGVLNADAVQNISAASYPWSYIVMGDPQPADSSEPGDGSVIFRDFIEVWNDLEPAPKFAWMLGDLTDNGVAADYTTATTGYIDEVESCDIPIISVVGNHEVVDSTGPNNFKKYIGDYDWYWDYGGYRFIYLENVHAGGDYGYDEYCQLDSTQLVWLEDLLDDDIPSFVGMHITMQEIEAKKNSTPGDPSIGNYCKDCGGTSKFEDLCEEYDVQGVFYGHWHYFAWNFIKGIPYIGAGHAREDRACGLADSSCWEDFYPYNGRFPSWVLVTVESASLIRLQVFVYGDNNVSDPIYDFYILGDAEEDEISAWPSGFNNAQIVPIKGVRNASTDMQIPFIIYSDALVDDVDLTVGGVNYTKDIEFSVTENSGSSLTDYQVQFYIDTLKLDEIGLFADDADGDEIAITDASYNPLYYWRPEYSRQEAQWGDNYIIPNFPSFNTEYWFKGNLTASTTHTFHFLINSDFGADDSSSYFSGANTFAFFDDFDRTDSSAVGNGWTENQNAGSIENHKLRIQSPDANDNERAIEKAHGLSSGTYTFTCMFQNVYTIGANKRARIMVIGTTANTRSSLSVGRITGDDQITYLDSGGSHQLDSLTNPKDGTWMHWNITYNFDTDNIIYTVDGVSTAEVAKYTGSTSTAGRFYFGNYDIGETKNITYIDYVFARKYIATTPTVTIPSALDGDITKRGAIVLGLNDVCQDFPNDQRPYDLDGNELTYYIENEAVDPIEGYVLVTADLSEDQSIVWYYNNDSLSETESSTDTFIRYEDFESYSVNDVPAGDWSVDTANGGTVTVQSVDSSKVLRVVQGNTGVTRAKLDLDTMGMGVLVQYRARMEQLNKDSYMEFLGNGAGTQIASEFIYGTDNNGHRYWVNGGTRNDYYPDPSHLTASTWYDCQQSVYYDINTYNFTLWVNSVPYRGEDRVAVTSIDTWTPWRASTTATSGTYYVDDVIVRKFTWPMPLPMTPKAEVLPIVETLAATSVKSTSVTLWGNVTQGTIINCAFWWGATSEALPTEMGPGDWPNYYAWEETKEQGETFSYTTAVGNLTAENCYYVVAGGNDTSGVFDCGSVLWFCTSSSDYAFGIVNPNANYSTGLDAFLIRNCSSGNTTVTIGSSQWAGGTAWTPSNTGSPGTNIIGIYAGLSGGSYSVVVRYAVPFNTLIANFGNGTYQEFGIKVYTPTNSPFPDGTKKTGNITLYQEAL